jgi:hypothetical protein
VEPGGVGLVGGMDLDIVEKTNLYIVGWK